MQDYELIKVNESFYSFFTENKKLLKQVRDTLTISKPPAYNSFSRFPTNEYFFRLHKNKMIIPIGLIPFLAKFGVHRDPSEYAPEFTEEEIHEYIENCGIPFKPYDHQIKMITDSLIIQKQINLSCTGSGKSVAIGLISDFLLNKGLKGIIVVPSISLVQQIHSDFKDYNLMNLHSTCHLIGGSNKEKHLDNQVTITTRQSLALIDPKLLSEVDFVICDEVHGARGDQTADIIRNCIKAKYKIGLTGTLPDNALEKMEIFSQLSIPKTYIKTQDLINLGLATPVNINVIRLGYPKEFSQQINKCDTYSQRLKLLKEHENRTKLVSNLTVNVTKKGSSIMLYQHTEHGKELFKQIYKLRTGIDIENKHITGKKAFEFQKEHRIYFINGEVKDTIREEIRQIFDNDNDVILVGNYACLSTGINIKSVHNIIFGSPMKSFISITQSLGRGIRLYPGKEVVNIYDIADNLYAFNKQLDYRIKASYQSENFPIYEKEIFL